MNNFERILAAKYPAKTDFLCLGWTRGELREVSKKSPVRAAAQVLVATIRRHDEAVEEMLESDSESSWALERVADTRRDVIRAALALERERLYALEGRESLES